MELRRKPFQGVMNIIRFNWHFYLLAFLFLMALILLKSQFPEPLQYLVNSVVILSAIAILVSLLVSFYVYDFSDLYQLNWLDPVEKPESVRMLTIHAGFDESSEIIRRKFRDIDLSICDFYDPRKHTEISIKRARRAYPADPATRSIQSDKLPFQEDTFDLSLVMFSAHEIRNDNERVRFFKELNRVTLSSGQVIIVEHLRDFANFLAYTLGFFHFYSRKTWLTTFNQAGLSIRHEQKITSFIRLFILEHHGNTL